MVTMSPVVHFEMPAEDRRRRMASFYEKTFGWKTQMLGPDMGDYVLVTTAESDVKPGAPAGAINGGFLPEPDWPGAAGPGTYQEHGRHGELNWRGHRLSPSKQASSWAAR